ncbi:hypothetical protein [Nocardia gipuzkoensis]|uniref:hypothetical protein n=1 Tax=Nocardia gipuzkoensis TaxID=2749991 RepID=UPI00237EDAC5|nr:hypothetical protein [Nocardia gipuzkoensis]MDE1674170.1 hypothetical protein [Nocardia gipuzkoensis]
MTNALPKRVPFPRPRAPYKGVPLPMLERYAAALRQWAAAPERPGGGVPTPPPPPVTLTEALSWAE